MNSSRGLRLVLALGLAATMVAVPPSSRLLAQAVNATLQGVVTDAGGAAVPQATVTVKNTATGSTRNLVSDAQGRYLAPNLEPGSYEIVVQAPTFSRKVFSGITLSVGDSKTVDAPLSAGAVDTTVDVTAVESNIQLTSSSNSTLIDNKQVVELPLANRQFYSLALLSPAAFQPAQNSTLGFRGGINIAGSPEISNLFTFNGIYNDDIGVAQPSYRPSVETIQEFRLLTGVYPAEYGRMFGGQVVVISKSGGNSLHGSAYEFNRNEWSDAKNFFTAPGAKTPRFRQNTFGGTVSGPIWKDHTFFFLGYEEQLINQAFSALGTVPTTGLFAGETNMLNGVFNDGNKIYDPNTGVALTPVAGTTTTYDLKSIPTTEPINFYSAGAVVGQRIATFGYTPAPATYATAAGKAPASNYAFQENRLESMHEGTVKIDHKISDKDNVTASFNVFEDPSFEPNNSLCSSYVLPNGGCMVNQISTILYASYDRIITANLVNDFRVGFQRLQQPRYQQDNFSDGAAFAAAGGLPTSPGEPYLVGYANNLGLPNTSVTGYSTVGGPTNLPQDRYDNHYNLVDTLTWTHKAHTFKFGVDLLLAKTVNLSNSTTRGSFSVSDSGIYSTTNTSATRIGSTGDNFADLMLGLAYSSTLGNTAYHSYQNFNSQDFFVQDDWKLLPNLTLNIGVRYELDSPLYAPNGVQSNFNIADQTFHVPNNAVNQAICAAGTANCTLQSSKYVWNKDLNNFAPRFGFSYQPFHNANTVLKGAIGVFYSTPLTYNQYLGVDNTQPFKIVPTFLSAKSPTGVAASAQTNGTVDTAVGTIQMSSPFQIPNQSAPAYCQGPSGTSRPTGCSTSLSATAINPNYRTPYMTEWSLGIQRQLTKAIVLEATYFGTKGTKLPLSKSLDVINPATASSYLGTTAAPGQANRPYPYLNAVTYNDTAGDSSFHSLQSSLKQSYQNGLTFIVAYTWSHSIDGGQGTGSSSNSSSGIQNPYNPRADRGTSDFNVKHRLIVSPVYELPLGKGKPFMNSGLGSALLGGFQVSGIIQFQTGRPFTVVDPTSNTAGFYGTADRPNQISNPNVGAPHTVAQWFNPYAFSATPTFVKPSGSTVITSVGAFGNEGRNNIIGPQYTKVDLTLARKFPIFEKVNGEFRVETFNLFNHPNFFNPLTTGIQFPGTAAAPTVCPAGVTSTAAAPCAAIGSFGAITQANDPRDLQFGLRVIF